MSRETEKMSVIRKERIALKKAVIESENRIREQRNLISEAWPHRDTNKEAFRAIKRHGRVVKKEKDSLVVYRRLLRATKDDIKRLNRQHDFRMRAIAEANAE